VGMDLAPMLITNQYKNMRWCNCTY